ncbi:MAG TPA: ribosome maturation factor RimM [Pseudolabrys sp.]|nr:ribosome maturation factor RimM [Pseudolabrys sp.]
MAKPRNRHGSPSPLVGEGRPSQERGRGEGASLNESPPPHPSRAALPRDASHPLPQGEREESSKVLVARFGAAHGVRGEIRLWSFTADPLTIADYGALESKDGKRQFVIDTLRPNKDFLVARIDGVADRNAAEALRNVELYLPRERLPAIHEDDTWYYADLVGLAAVAPDGAAIGTVAAVYNFGAGDIVEISPAAGGKTLLLPFTEAVVPEVDVKAKRIVVVMPEEIEAREGDDTKPGE